MGENPHALAFDYFLHLIISKLKYEFRSKKEGII